MRPRVAYHERGEAGLLENLGDREGLTPQLTSIARIPPITTSEPTETSRVMIRSDSR